MRKVPAALSNENLSASVIPPRTAPWHVIGEFALTFKGDDRVFVNALLEAIRQKA